MTMDEIDTEREIDMEMVGTAEMITPLWQQKARENVEKWGLQSAGVILLAIAEEVGEMAREMRMNGYSIDGDDVDAYSLDHALKEVEAVGTEIQSLHEDVYEDDDGNPIDGPTIEYDGETGPMADELADTAALLYQLQARLDQINLEE